MRRRNFGSGGTAFFGASHREAFTRNGASCGGSGVLPPGQHFLVEPERGRECQMQCGKIRTGTAFAVMAERKHEVERPYPPDYVSAETLGYRLDLSRSTVERSQNCKTER